MKKLLLVISVISSIGMHSALHAMEQNAVPMEIVAAADQQVCSVCMEPKSLASFYRLRCGHDSCCRACLINIINDRIARRELAVIPCPEQPCEMKFNAADMRGITGSDEAHKALEAIKDEIIGAAVTMPLSNDPWSAETKPCPCCGIIIEKDAGCVEMTCNRCSYQFCWDCMRPFWETGGHAAPPVGHSYGAGFHIPGSVACGKQPLAPEGGALSLDHKLLEASQHNNPYLARLLLRAGAHVDARDSDGGTPLLSAAGYGNFFVVRALLAHGADASSADRRGETPLQLASFVGNIHIIGALIAAGATVNCQRDDGVAPLLSACQEGHLEVVQALLAAGADVNMEMRPNKWPALFLAVKYGHLDIVRTLIHAGADVNHKDSDKKTPLKIALDNRDLKMMKVLVTAGADIRTDGYEILFESMSYGCLDLVKALISAGADINMNGPRGTPLYCACLYSQSEIVRELLTAGANVNGASSYGQTALMVAGKRENLEIVRLLLKYGADTRLRDQLGKTAHEYANAEIKAILRDHECAMAVRAAFPALEDSAPRRFIEAVIRDNVALVEEICRHGVDINCKTAKGETALMLAAQQGNLAMIRALIAARADPDALNNYGIPALFYAMETGTHDAIVLELIAAHANVNLKNYRGMTALMIASYRGTLDVVHALIAAGADLNAGGGAALSQAAWNNRIEVVRVLIAAGADVNCSEDGGRTALIEASAQGRCEIVRILLEAGADVNYRTASGETALNVSHYREGGEINQLLRDAGARE